MKYLLIIMLSLSTLSCNNDDMKKTYVIEITTFKYKSTVSSSDFWIEDQKIESNYTSLQPGFIKRESGFSEESGEVAVVVYWQTENDAENSMKKFMNDNSVVKFVNMIDPKSMKMKRYSVK